MSDYYKCASVKNALDISGVANYLGNQDKLVNYSLTYKNTELGVTCADPTITGITYELDEYIVALLDLLPIEFTMNTPNVGILKTQPYLVETENREEEVGVVQVEHTLLGEFNYEDIPFIFTEAKEIPYKLLDGTLNSIKVSAAETVCPSDSLAVELSTRCVIILDKEGNEIALADGTEAMTLFISSGESEVLIRVQFSCYLLHSEKEGLIISDPVTITQKCSLTASCTVPIFSYYLYAPLHYLDNECPQHFLPLESSSYSQWFVYNYSNVKGGQSKSTINAYLLYDSEAVETFTMSGLAVYLNGFMPSTTWENLTVTSVTATSNPDANDTISNTATEHQLTNGSFGLREDNVSVSSGDLTVAVCKSFPYGDISNIYDVPPGVTDCSVLLHGINFFPERTEPAYVAKVEFDVSYEVRGELQFHTFVVNVYLITTPIEIEEPEEEEPDTPEVPGGGNGGNPAYKYKTKDGQMIEEANYMYSYPTHVLSNPIVYEATLVYGSDGYIYVYLPAEHVQYGFLGYHIFAHLDSTAYKGNENLTKLVLLANYTEIRENSCRNCTSLRTVKFPPTLCQIWGSAFEGCTALEKADFSKLTTDMLKLWGSCFKNASRMTLVKCNSESTIKLFLNGEVFLNCINLKAIEGLFSIVHMLEREFKRCINLSTDICKHFNPDSDLYTANRIHEYQLIPEECFEDCFEMKTVTILHNCHTYYVGDSGKGVVMYTTKSKNAFKNCGVEKLYIEGTQYRYLRCGFSSNTFIGCKNVKEMWCDSDRVPFMGAKNIWHANAIDPQTCILHVPKGLKSLYARHALWGDFNFYGNLVDDIE